jgi:SAM-dependent methyltransferase
MNCPLCKESASTEFFTIENVPVTGASVFATAKEAKSLPSGRVQLANCARCGFVFNRVFDPRLGEIGAQYESSQAASAHFGSFAQSLAEDWVARHRLTGKAVLEVGCGGGNFLRRLVECGVGKAIGIDPLADVTGDAHMPEIELIARPFDVTQLGLAADALVCRHTLEHIQDVHGFLSLLRRWAAADPQRVVLFEVPDAERIFAERAFWDIYYEHCNYFTEQTIRNAFVLAGFEVTRATRAYDDQYLIVEARARSQAASADASPTQASLLAKYREFADDVRIAIEACEAALRHLRTQHAPLILWQGAAKTVGFMSALHDQTVVDGAIDLSPQRQGKFLPGSGLPVYAPEELRRLAPKFVVLMNPVYLDEVRARIAALGLAITVYPVNALLKPSFVVS